VSWRFQRRLRIIPGVTLNVGKRGASVSIGSRGAHVTYGRRGKRATIGLPGSGLAYSVYQRYHKGAAPPPTPAAGSAEFPSSRRAPVRSWKFLAVITAGIIAVGLAISNTQKTTPGRVTLEAKTEDLQPKTGAQRPQEPGAIQSHNPTDLPSIQSRPGGQTHAGMAPPWLELRKGARAYTGDDGGGENTLTVCPSAYLYNKQRLKWVSNTTAILAECKEKRRGIPVTVSSNQIFSSAFEGEYFIFIRADDSAWTGWTGSLGLQPRIPANTNVVVTLSPEGETWLFPNRTSADGHIILRTGATLQILAQDPKSGDRPDLYVQITGNSADAGKKGWLHQLGLNVQGGVPLLFAPPNGIKPPTVAESSEPSGNRIVLHGPVWSCPTVEILRKLIGGANETAEKDSSSCLIATATEERAHLATAAIRSYEGKHRPPPSAL